MKSIFWKYFKDTLGWALIHSPGPISVIAKGVALVFDDIREDIFWLRDQLNPLTCEEQYLPTHGATRGIPQHPLESTNQYRKRVVKAYAWHRQGGKAEGMPKILEHYGYEGCTFYNCRKDDEARWAEFKAQIPVPEYGLEANDYSLVTWAVQETKPARSKLVALQTHSTIQGAANASGTLLLCSVVTLEPEKPKEALLTVTISSGCGLHTITTTSLG